MRNSFLHLRNAFVRLLVGLTALFTSNAIALPIITAVTETGGDNEATDTITAKWTGVTFPVSIANEPVPGAVVGATYSVGFFGNHAPTFVDRNHRYTNAVPVPMPAYLDGNEYIMSGNDNRDNAGYRLDVTVAKAVRVYMLIDNRLQDGDGNTPPTFGPANMQWILDEGWAAMMTGANRAGNGSIPDEIGIDESANGSIDQYYSIYTKDFPAGTFQLKQADNAGRNMYGVVIAAAPNPLENFINIGANAIGSATSEGGGSITIVGGGNDIWDQTDEFTYAYTEKSGDFDVQVRVESLDPNARWSKAGIMVRETLAEDSRMVFLRVAPPDVPTSNGGNGANDTKLGYRTGAPDVAGESGGNHEDPADQNAPPYPNAWLKLVRAGNVFTASISADGSTWTQIASQDTGAGDWVAGGGPFRENVVVGLGVSRHSGGPTATAKFHDFSFVELPFTVLQASSRGNPKGILVSFSGTPDTGHLDPLSYSTDPPLNIESVTPGPVVNSYWLNTTETLAEGTTYTVMVFGPTKGGLGPLVETDTFVHGAGYEARRIHVSKNKESSGSLGTHYTRTGTKLGLFSTAEGGPALTGNTLFEDPLADNGSNERFATHIFGILNITAPGNYVFAASSDDVGEGFLSTDATPANKVLIVREPQWNGSRQYTTADRRPAQADLPGNPLPNISTPKNLTAGEYYLEYVFDEGGGGNNGSITWQPPGGPAIVAGQSPIPESAFALSRYVNGPTKGELFRTLGPIQITRQPASQAIQALQPVTFGVRVDGTPAYRYQWKRNGTPIAGANGSSYTIATTLPSDDGAKFSVSIANEFSSANSDEATLTVINPQPPHVVSVAADSSFTTVTVKFDNKLQPASAQDTINYVIPGLTVSAATLINETTVRLTTTQQTEGQGYTLTISNVRELTGINALDPNPTVVNFSAVAFTPGFITRQWFFGITGDNNIQRVLEHPKYVNGTPDYSCLTNIAEANAGDTCDNCGERVVGLFVPRESGPHIFYLAADDGARLFLGTDETPASKVAIANEPVWASRRLWNGEAEGGGRGTPPANVSAPIDLVAGSRYYIEAVVKEGGGGDHVAVAVQTPSDAAPPANGSTPITGDLIGVYASPDGATLAITQQPAPVTVVENQSATFTVAATGSSPLCGGKLVYQWQKNGVNIPGATGPTLTLGRVTMGDNGAMITCTAYVPGRKAVSTPALLTVLEDTQGPVALSAVGSATFEQVVIGFDELLDPTLAEDNFNYTLAPEVEVVSAVLNPDGRSVTLTTLPQSENTVYTVTINLLQDLVGNEIIANSTVQFRSFVTGCGGVEFMLYTQVGGGTDINILANHPTFPNSPDEIRHLNTFDTGSDIRDNYGGRVRGLFIPPVSGAWNLFVTADDGSRLFFNPNGPNAAGKMLISEETPGCCTGFAGRRTGPFNLVAGQGYFLEGIYKEAGGGDYIRVAARLEADTTTALAPMPAAWAGYPAAPPGVGGPVNITTQPPATLQALEQTVATITVVAENPNGLPLCYQWQVSADGGATFADVAGANTATLSGRVDTTLDGAKFRCVIGVIGGSTVSAVTTLDVLLDEQKPQVASIKGSEFFDTITIKFNELVDETTATDEFNFSVDGGVGTPEDITLLADGMTVVLKLTSLLAEGQTYTVTINSVKDRASTPNEIEANTQATFRSFVVSGGFLNFAVYKNIGGVAVSELVNSPNFPNTPDERAYLSSFDTRGHLPTDALENYGGRITGYFVPPTSGDWILYLRSDDASQLLFDKKDGAGKQLVTEEPGCCAAFSAHATAPMALTAGEKYPVEVLYKEGGGGDYAQVAARLASDTLSSLVPIPGTMIAAAADPTGAAITITQQPVDVLYVIDPANPTGAGTTLVTQDFNADNGGFTVENTGSPASPWSYNAGTGTWSCYHTDPCGPAQNATRLISPPITVTRAGRVGVVLTHRYSFEGDNWDGGQMRVSINGGPFVTVPSGSFSEGGYNSTSLIGNHPLLGQAAWNGDSANYTAGANITSRASLGFANAGDTIRVQLLAAFDECSTGKNPSWVVDALALTEGAQDPTFRVAATGAILGDPDFAPFIQWERNNGGGWVAVPNGTSPNLLLNPVLSDNGTRFRAQLYVPGTSTTSAEAVLTVVQINTPPKFDCGPNQTLAEDSGAQVVPEWAKNISHHSITRVATVFSSTFDTLPAGSRLLDPSGAAVRPNPRVEAGILKLTDANDPGGFGGWALGPFPLATYESVQASWKSQIGGGGGGGADGYSLNIGTDLADNFTGEEGTGTGLSVTVDTFDNGGGEVGLEIRWRGERVAFQALPKDDDGTGNYLRKGTFVDASMSVDPSGLATFNYDGNVISAQLSSYAGVRATQINLGARTGGANDNHWIDNLSVAGFPFDASSAEAGQTVQFEVSNDNPSLFAVQPAVSANGTLSYTPAPNACGMAEVTVVARDSGGTAYGGDDTSSECRFTITLTGTDDTAVAQDQTISPTACGPVAITLTALDPDANGCGSPSSGLVYAVVSGPTKGTLTGTAPNLTYTSTASGQDSFTFSVTDGASVTVGTVTINIPICNTPPVAKMQLSPLADFSPSVATKLAISCNGSNACLVADGSQSFDLETPNSGLTFQWYIEPSLVPAASGEVTQLCLELGQQTVMLVVTDPQGATGTDHLTVEVVTASEAIDELIARVNASTIERRNKRPFLASLKSAAAAADRGQAHTAQNILGAFQNKVRAQVGKTNPEEAQIWIRWAQSIIDAQQGCVEPEGQE